MVINGHAVAHNILGRSELVEKLLTDVKLAKNPRARQGLEDMQLLFKYLTVFGVTENVRFSCLINRSV
jgi:histidyl-tRNA synthetase